MEEKLDLTGSLEPKKRFGLKLFLIGIPLYMLQLVAVYYITGNIILNDREREYFDKNKVLSDTTLIAETENTNTGEKKETKETKPDEKQPRGEFFYSVEDVVINPAGTKGNTLMIVSVGFDLASEAEVTKMKEKEVIVKDFIINTLSSKSLPELSRGGAYRDSLKTELLDGLRPQLEGISLNSLYFYKYIIQ